MRLRPLVPAGLAVLAVAILPAAALAGPTVVANEDSASNRDFFTPSTPPPIPLGDSVTFTNGVGQHNVAWDAGGFPTKPNLEGTTSPWTFSRTFTKPGVYGFYCTVHGEPHRGMFGTVTVLLANGSTPKAPTIGRVTATPGSSQVTLRFTSSVAGTATGRLTRRQGRSFRSFGSVKLTVRKGSNSLKLKKTSSGSKLVKGSYQLALTFSDGASNLTSAKTLKFTISR
jgi:plastocyanin